MLRTGVSGLSPGLWIFLQLEVLLFTYVQGSVPLRFDVEPADALVPPGGAVLLHCAAAGAAGARMLWRWAPALPLDEAPLLDTTGDPYRKILSNGSLQLTQVGTGAQAGDYQCLLSREGQGTIVSRIATVSLPNLPIFDAEPQDLTLYPRESAFFACLVRFRRPSYTKPSALARAHHAPPLGPMDIKILWLKNEAPLRLDETRMTLLPSGALEIDPVGPQDGGAYRCNVSRQGGSGYRLSNKAQLTINMDLTLSETVTAPKFIAEPRSQTVIEGSPVTMDCAALGNPRPDITWLNNGKAIDLNHLDSRFTLLGLGALYISSVKESDAGTYQCRADNREDSLDATAILDVQVPPRFMTKPLDTVAAERQDLELACQVYGHPEPTVRWLKNGEVITPNNHDMALVGGYNLRIQGLMAVDMGMFQCVASNPVGNIQASAQLTVLSPGSTAEEADAAKTPSEPLDFTALIVKARFVALSWSEPVTTNGDIVAYSVIYKVKGFVRERIMNTTRGDVHKMNIPSLQPNTAYHFRALAYNNKGAGASTQVLEITTQSEELSLGPPQNLKVVSVSPTALAVSWEPPQPVPGSKVTVDKYELLWAESESGEERSLITSETSGRLANLRPFTEYAVRVVAHAASPSSVGDSPSSPGGSPSSGGSPSEQVLVRTPGDAPSSPPFNLTLQPYTSSSVMVSWEAPPLESRNGDLTGYKIRYRPHTGRTRAGLLTTPADIRSVVLKDLDRMATYQVRVCAFNVNGTGPFTEWQNVETLQNDLDESQVPAEPSPLITQAGSDSIFVSWGPPLRNQNTRVRGYIITWGKGIPDGYLRSLGEPVRHFTITDLESNSEYVITLRASNQVGEGPPVYATVRTKDPSEADGDLDIADEDEEAEEEEGGNGGSARGPAGPQLIPPVGVKADVISGTTAVVYWTDTTLTKSQLVTDQRFYVVRYSSMGAQRHKYFNTTHLNCMLDDLRPFTQYEFTVKVVKGNRESPWSMVVVNSTLEAAPGSAPRDVRVAPGPTPSAITLHWLPPNKANGAVTGYVILYTTDRSKRDRDWVVQAVVGGGTSASVRPLHPDTAYHFKVQARNAQGYGPFSHDVTFTTPPEARHSYSVIVYASVGLVVVLLLITGIVATIICCRRNNANPTPSPDSRAKSTYQKSSASNIKPPDLWIHHDQMELKQMDKSHHSTSGSGDGVSGVSSMTLPRPSRDSCEYETAMAGGHSNPPCSSLDKRHYVPTYVGSSPTCGEPSLGGNSSAGGGASSRNSAFLSTGGQSGGNRPMVVAKPKPLLSVEHFSRDPSMSSINTCTISSGNPEIIPPGMRPMYPRTQYPVPAQQSRHHLNIDQNTPLLSAAGSSISGTLPSQSSISSLGQASALHHHHPTMGVSPMSCSQISCVASAPPCPSPSPASEGFPADAREREQGHYVAYEALHPPRDSLEAAGASGSLGRRGAPVHPLRSFSVPAPPPSDAPHTPHHHVSVTIRPTNTSPYKKPLVPAIPVGQSPSSALGQSSILNRLQQGMLVPHSGDELEPLAPSCSTERLHQEMANLEGLMKDLNAITANQFEC